MPENKKITDSKFDTGAVRSADVAHFDFTSLPLLGLLSVMKVAGGGGTKYGRFNYMQGMPLHETLNHVAVHFIRYCLGDRSEPHLAKMAWGAMVAEQTAVLNPELCEPHMLGEGATLTAAMLAEMERGKPERDTRRRAGEFEGLFDWNLAEMPEAIALLKRRKPKPPLAEVIATAWAATEKSDAALGSIEIKGRGPVEVDDEGFIVIPQQNGGAHHVDPNGSHPLDHLYRTESHVPVDPYGNKPPVG